MWRMIRKEKKGRRQKKNTMVKGPRKILMIP